jgi:hypothetical protein
MIGSPLMTFFPGVRGDDERILDEQVKWSSKKKSIFKSEKDFENLRTSW